MTKLDWQQPLTPPALIPGEVHIWWLELGGLPCYREILSTQESSRLNNFAFHLGAQHFCASRTALRTLLGHYLNCPPQDVPIILSSEGKPYIGTTSPSLHFNLSHSADTGLLAVCHGNEIGIDIEVQRKLDRIEAVARRIFQPLELEALEQSGWNSDLFYDLWTCMEARQKCLGRGVFAPPVEKEQVETKLFNPTDKLHAALAWPLGTAPKAIHFFNSSDIL